MFFKNRKFFILGIVVVAAAAAATLYFKKPWDGFSNAPLISYSHPAFGVSLRYPAGWTADLEGGAFNGIPLRYEGTGGYFGVDALAAENDFELEDLLDRVVMKNPAIPYGTRPVIKSTEINGVEARVVLPSDDQKEEANNEALFLARYPADRQIGDNVFRFFILYAHKDYLEDILRTFSFDLSGGAQPSGGGE